MEGMTSPARWAILGTGAISADFARALPHARHGVLHAVGGRDAGRARAFADEVGAEVAGTADEILARDDVDAVYVGTVHTAHVSLATAALAAGKAVLCEKPLSTSVADTERLLAAAEASGLPLVEAFKYRFGPFPDRMRQIVAGGDLGEIVEIESAIGFVAGRSVTRLFDPAVAGGAILDAGCYPVSLAVGVAAWAGRLGQVSVARADGAIGETGVDEDTRAVLDLGGITAHVETAITRSLPRRAVIRGTTGELRIDNVWGSRVESTADAVIIRPDGTEDRIHTPTTSPMAAEADATILALREGRTQAPEMPWFESLATARLLEQWRAAID